MVFVALASLLKAVMYCRTNIIFIHINIIKIKINNITVKIRRIYGYYFRESVMVQRYDGIINSMQPPGQFAVPPHPVHPESAKFHIQISVSGYSIL